MNAAAVDRSSSAAGARFFGAEGSVGLCDTAGVEYGARCAGRRSQLTTAVGRRQSATKGSRRCAELGVGRSQATAIDDARVAHAPAGVELLRPAWLARVGARAVGRVAWLGRATATERQTRYGQEAEEYPSHCQAPIRIRGPRITHQAGLASIQP